jgi:hypothetical protein
MRWFTIRKAVSLTKEERDTLERFGAATVAALIYGGFSGPLNTEPQKSLYENSTMRQHALEWLTEEYDRAERRETWLITMEAAVTVFVAAELLLSILALWRQPIPSTASGRTVEFATATLNHWQRAKECSEQAERMAQRRWASDTPDGYILVNGINHYSPKYDRCDVEVFFSTGHRRDTNVPFMYSMILDAFEGTRISSCVGGIDEAEHSADLSKIWCDGDCAACRSFEKDRMTN